MAAAHPLAVEAGLEILRRGGNAVDAAIAVQMVLGVVEPQASGIGGGGFLLHYDGASRAITVYDGRETAPAGATPTMFLAPDGRALGYREAVVSGMSVGVPGVVAMLRTRAQGKGQARLGRSVRAGNCRGATASRFRSRLVGWLQRIPGLRDELAIRETCFDADGSPRKLGERITNPALADTMA